MILNKCGIIIQLFGILSVIALGLLYYVLSKSVVYPNVLWPKRILYLILILHIIYAFGVWLRPLDCHKSGDDG